MRFRLLILAAGLAAAAPVLAQEPAPSGDAGPVSTASQTTDQKIAAWLGDKAPPAAPRTTRDQPQEFLRDPNEGVPDRKIHGEVGAAVGSGGYRSAYGVANIPIGKSSSVTVAVSTAHGRYPYMAGGAWGLEPAGVGVRADCVCREAPDGSEQCRVGRAATRLDADLAEGACGAAR